MNLKRYLKFGKAVINLYISRIFNKNKKGIAFIVNSFEKGGVEQVVLNLYKGFRSKEYPSYVVSLSNNIGIFANELECPNHLRILNYDVIDLINYCAKNNIRTLHYHYATFNMKLMKLLGFKIFYTIHNTYIWYSNEDWNALKSCLKYCDGIIAVSDWTKNYFIKKTNIKNVTTIINGIDIKKLSENNVSSSITRNSLNLAPSDKVFVNVASITEGKYQMCFIKVMEEIIKKRKDIKILLVGNILDKKYYKDFMKELNKSKSKDFIKFVNYIPQNELSSFLKTVPNAFILPSIHEAGVTLSTIEALLNGLPVIITDFDIKNTFPVFDDIITIPTPYNNILELTPKSAKKLSRNLNPINKKEIIKKIIYVADNSENLRKKVEPNKYKIFSVENMVNQHINFMF